MIKYAAEIDGFFDESPTLLIINNCFEYITSMKGNEILHATQDFRLFFKICLDKHEQVWSEWRELPNNEAIV